MKPEILTINQLFDKKLIIPNYQRPYKWTDKNITDLILDIQDSIKERQKYGTFNYRIGSVILYENEKKEYEIVDGQQRTLSLLLLKLYLDETLQVSQNFSCYLLDNTNFSDKATQYNLHYNYKTIREWFSSVDDDKKKQFHEAFEKILEVVVIFVNNISEAFQLFDSQNTRGRALYPHDLLKAYHLREIRDKYEMQSAVVKWESKDPKAIRELFDLYLYPLWNWAKRKKYGKFTSANIDIYKGIEEKFGYTYAHRANKAMPYFLITEPFISGGDFFEMVDHYMQMLHNIKEEIVTNPDFKPIKEILTGGKDAKTVEELNKCYRSSSKGLNYASNLFFCALLCYYDRFHNFDVMAVKKLFTWAMMIRVDMKHLGLDTINRYAIGFEENNNSYSNTTPVISMITYARRHTEISGMRLDLRNNDEKWKTNLVSNNRNWVKLYKSLCDLNGYKCELNG